MPRNPNAVQNNKTKLFIFYYETMSKFMHLKHICYIRYSPNIKNNFIFNINICTQYREKGLENRGVYY